MYPCTNLSKSQADPKTSNQETGSQIHFQSLIFPQAENNMAISTPIKDSLNA